MITKRQGFIASGVLAGALLLGTAGLAAAQDPTGSHAPNPMWTGPGAGQMGAGMSGQMGAGMSGQMGAMGTDGAYDDAQMAAMHAQHHTTN